MRRSVAGIYLAAGLSSRMGTAKHSIRLPDGSTVGSQALQAAMHSKLTSLTVVTGPSGEEWIPEEFLRWKSTGRGFIKANIRPEYGISHSIYTGMSALDASSPSAVVILLADQPLITANMIDALIDEFCANPHLDYVASGKNGVPQPPSLFSRSLFPTLKGLVGDEGARSIFTSERYRGRVIPQPADHLFDVDTPTDVKVLLECFKSCATPLNTYENLKSYGRNNR